jgi:hypothetical protein
MTLLQVSDIVATTLCKLGSIEGCLSDTVALDG